MTSLTEPLSLRCGTTVPNRIALAPLTNTQSHSDGTLSSDELRWLVRRAEGGFGWISTCATYVCDEGKAWDGQLGLANDAHEEAIAPAAEALRAAGCVGVVQLHHAGAKASLAPETRLSTVDNPEHNVRGATASDLERVQRDFVDAAQRAERAGFHGVEIHGANGYLFTQFLAPEDNPRRDAFGGSLARRAKLLRRTLRAVREAVAPGFAVGVRISPVDVWTQRGLVLDDALQLVEWLVEDGADFVHLSLADARAKPPHEPDADLVTTAIRARLRDDVALFAAGGLWTAQDATELLEMGADMAVLGRAAIANPDWPTHIDDPDWEPIRPPWDIDMLQRDAAIGDDFVEYLHKFRNLLRA